MLFNANFARESSSGKTNGVSKNVISVATTYAGREVVFPGVTSSSGVSLAARLHRVSKCFPFVLQRVALVCAKIRVKLHISRRSSGPQPHFPLSL